jgi:hypothetical protein
MRNVTSIWKCAAVCILSLCSCSAQTASEASSVQEDPDVKITLSSDLLTSLSTDADTYTAYLEENNPDDFKSIKAEDDGSVKLVQTAAQNSDYLSSYAETVTSAADTYANDDSNNIAEITFSKDYGTVSVVLDGTDESQADSAVCTLCAVYAEVGQIFLGVSEDDLNIYVKIMNSSHIVIDQIHLPEAMSGN